MDDAKRACIAIDLKSYYASVECVERGLDPLDTNLVVADEAAPRGRYASPSRLPSRRRASPDALGSSRSSRR